MEQMGYNQNDFAKIIDLKSRACEILNRKRKLFLEMIPRASAIKYPYRWFNSRVLKLIKFISNHNS